MNQIFRFRKHFTKICITILLLVVCHAVQAKPVSIDRAYRVALNQYVAYSPEKNKSSLLGTVNLELSKEVKSEISKLNNESLYYIFTNKVGKGFVIVSADDAVEPVLGYSTENKMDVNNLPPAFEYWMWTLGKQIEAAKLKNIKGSESVSQRWNKMENADEKSLSKMHGTSGVATLCQAKWNQNPSPYYDMCPKDPVLEKRSVVGCVATAMAIIMRYHQYPKQGTGWSSYNHPKYGTLSVNYGATTYDWANMPNLPQEGVANEGIATISYHCGVSCNMEYSPESSGTICLNYGDTSKPVTENALRKYFGYPNAKGYERKFYSDAEWEAMVKKELDAKRPVFYVGAGPGGGHAFVCDGYDDNSKFSYNWGWGGNSDGYYASKALEPKDLGTGAGNGTYNSDQEIIIGIEPPVPNQPNSNTGKELSLNDKLTASKDSINIEDPFEVLVKIKNSGVSEYSGSCYVGLFNEENRLISRVGEELPISLQKDATGELNFKTTGIKNALPGKYNIYAYYKLAGNWELIKPSNNFQNLEKLVVKGSGNSVELASLIKIPASTIEAGKTIAGTFELMNKSAMTFGGSIAVDLIDSKDETVMVLDTIELANNPINANAKSDVLNFNSTAINVTPGSYGLIVWYKPANGGDWEMVNATSDFKNPLDIIIIEPAIIADQYEDNNTEAKASKLIPTIIDKFNSKIKIAANLHKTTDLDYYEISFPDFINSSAEISARVHDERNSGDGRKYNADVILSYKLNGQQSAVYDDTIPNKINTSSKEKVIFTVAPAFAGFTGDYSLDVNIRYYDLSVEEDKTLVSSISPNPAADRINVGLGENYKKVISLEIQNTKGEKVKEISLKNNQEQNLTINVSDLESGTYFLKVKSESKYTTKAFVKVK